MGRYRTDVSFKLAAPDEVRVFRETLDRSGALMR